jgi:hypothetical protein
MIDPKMLVKEAAYALNISEKDVLSKLEHLKLPFYKSSIRVLQASSGLPEYIPV